MSRVFLDILIVLVAAKLAAEVSERVGVPSVVGEILAGIVIGPSLVGLVGSAQHSQSTEVLHTLGEIGVILLLLDVGMQMDLRELTAVGRAAMTVAVLGVVLPMVGGIGVGSVLGLSSNEALFAGSALAATSVGITARVFGDLRALGTIEARTVLGAAVADDVIGLIILTVVVRLTTGTGGVSILSLLSIVGLALGFLVLTVGLGTLVVPRLFAHIDRLARSSGTLVALALAFTLGVSQLATVAKLAPIVGAFVAGLALGKSSVAGRVQRELTPVGHLFIPVFFLQIGTNTDAKQFAKPSVLGLAGALIVIGVIGKLAAGVGAYRTSADKVLIGLGMIPRGEVGLIFASIGLREGILGADVYAAMLGMVLVTTLLTPPLLSARIRRTTGDTSPQPVAESAALRPDGGWIQLTPATRGRHVASLALTPPRANALEVGLEAAGKIVDADPSPELYEWLRRAAADSSSNFAWDVGSTDALFAVVRSGSERSWRFLETTSLLQRALPEFEDAVVRRRNDPALLDASIHHWDLLFRTRRILQGTAHDLPDDVVASGHARRLSDPDPVLFAALLVDMLGPSAETDARSQSVLERLSLGDEERQQIASLVSDRELLRAAAVRIDGLHEDSVLRIAAHLGSHEQARALYILSVAIDALEPWESALLTELHRLVQDSLDSAVFAGPEAVTLLDRTRDQALSLVVNAPRKAERIAAAPLSYLLSEEPEAVVRHSALLETLPPRATFRVQVHPESESLWRVEVGARDQLGLLALVTGVLERAQLDVADAVLATWGDGGALQAFRVRSGIVGVAPDADQLVGALIEAQTQSLIAPAVSDAVVTFDDAGSPWHTIAEVRATDRRGLLHALAVAFAAAGADVHAARITTNDSMALDRFDLTDRHGRKLDDETKAAVRLALSNGVQARSLGRRLPWAQNRVGTIRK